MNRNSRLPYYILGLLVLVALIWRAANPPTPPIPGPLGEMPDWDSMTKVGEMGPWAVNPSGTMWAGAWNQKTRDGKERSAVWVIDLEKKEARSRLLGDDTTVAALTWENDRTVKSMVRGKSPGMRVVKINAATAASKVSSRIAQPVREILAWPAASNRIAVLVAGKGPEIKAALLSESGAVIGKPAILEKFRGLRAGRMGNISPDGSLFVVSLASDEVGRNVTYYLVDSKAGQARKVFRSTDLPGRLEGIWVSPAGLLLVISERDKFHRMKYDLAGDKLEEVKPRTTLDLSASWPDAPENMMFVTYNAGYELNVATGAVKRLFDLSRLDKMTGYWREQVQDGRLYPRKDGNYTSVSVLANAIDIRVITKDGSRAERLLPRR